jgi:hypothetical protein
VQAYLYQDLVQTLSMQFASALTTIKAQYNFDLGEEFECALCTLLHSILPDRYGICRGFVVTADGRTAGDDIIVFEKTHFPTLALRPKGDFSRKEYIPVEAVFAYIEAKYTVYMEGDGGQSLIKALKQVRAVKELVATRPKVSSSQVSKYVNLEPVIKINDHPAMPSTANPAYAMILARDVMDSVDKRNRLDAIAINQALDREALDSTHPPDFMILGENTVVASTIPDDDRQAFAVLGPFFIPGKSSLEVIPAPGVSVGVGLASLMFALDWLRLGRLPWSTIIADGLKLEMR